ncbi:dTDP-glucose 4,6-dehydratase [Candidatus Kaiserbacteria bacterium RIFCSPHIGHO2_01_FULL_48_10]|uniref:dTDP-glucose 4,6-dehydratase n=1 Tax=Candidatus Kaiserbacteria bacterium RIFCSPHIGHO2_01_FULL_48_10 TaxID=1798476 RepID=A0A1F6C6E5_9BACT|nr:MAG: dTDP-glucose 4,6-dehydratase [Candidatus Kaiserbacteria bacterium RIFCSPHIGHO2_01_FULL_48_10]HLC99956.1 dTDP-glucose 4,6-dehydratase [Patescibacteria group bacterium]
MKILITGGAGFMGSNAVRYFLKTYPDIQIVNLDKLTYAGNLENLKDIENDSRYRFVKGDIADEKIVDEAVQGVDAIINYAAETHVDRSILEPRAFIVTDVLGTHTLLEAAKKHGIKKYIQISTDEVFGSIAKGKFKETSPFEPNSPYAASKAGGDHLCRAYFQTYGVPTIVTHSCNFFGPYQYPEKLIPLFITNLIEGKKVPVYGDGQQVREWIFTEDHCRAVDVILHKGIAGEVYNIGTGAEITNLEITKLLLQGLGRDESSIDYVKDRPGHDRRYAINSGKLRKLGWKPITSFEQGLAKTIAWYRENESWWKKIKSGEYMEYYKKQYQKV